MLSIKHQREYKQNCFNNITIFFVLQCFTLLKENIKELQRIPFRLK